MTVQTVLGVDIGSRGALAVMTGDGALVSVEDMPCLNDGPAGRRTVNGPLLARLAGPLGAALALIAGTAASKQEAHNG